MRSALLFLRFEPDDRIPFSVEKLFLLKLDTIESSPASIFLSFNIYLKVKRELKKRKHGICVLASSIEANYVSFMSQVAYGIRHTAYGIVICKYPTSSYSSISSVFNCILVGGLRSIVAIYFLFYCGLF